VHTGNNLSDLVQQECTPEHEEKYKQLFSKNLMQDKQKIKENIKLLKEENVIRKSYEMFLATFVNFRHLTDIYLLEISLGASMSKFS